jgi:hypothetical protein
MNPEKQNVVNELNAASQRIDEISKPKKDLPVARLHVESTKNGWAIFLHYYNGFPVATVPDFVFNNVFDCARKIVNLLCPGKGEEELQTVQIRKLSERLLGAKGDNDRPLLVAAEADRDHWRKIAQDNAKLAENRLTYIRSLEVEIRAQNKQFQNEPIEILPEEIKVRDIRACVDGQLFTIDDLCKAHSELKKDVANLRTENRQYSEIVDGEIKERTRLTDRLLNLQSEIDRLNRVLKETWKNHEAKCAEWNEVCNEGIRKIEVGYKNGFDAGVERVMKYVSGFCKETAERIARPNQNPS